MRNYTIGIGHNMANQRTCQRCKAKKSQKGGTNKEGQGFVCADCKPQVT